VLIGVTAGREADGAAAAKPINKHVRVPSVYVTKSYRVRSGLWTHQLLYHDRSCRAPARAEGPTASRLAIGTGAIQVQEE